MTSVLTAFDTCKKEFSDLKLQLKELDESWRNLSGPGGRKGGRGSGGGAEHQQSAGRAVSDALNSRKRLRQRSPIQSERLRREAAPVRPSIRSRISYNHGANSRDINSKNDDEDTSPPHKPSLLSTVVTTGKLNLGRSSTNPSMPSNNRHQPVDRTNREDYIDEQRKANSANSDLMKRHKRMFGMIIGTLARFQSEESARKGEVEKRREVERKVEESEKEAATKLASERQRIMQERRSKRAELRKTQLKLDRLEAHQEWEASHSKISEFIHTRAKPALCWLPKRLDPITEKKLKDSKDKNKLIAAERRAKLQKELADIDALYDHNDKESNTKSDDDDEEDQDEELENDQDFPPEQKSVLRSTISAVSGPVTNKLKSIAALPTTTLSGETTNGTAKNSPPQKSSRKSSNDNHADMELGEVED